MPIKHKQGHQGGIEAGTTINGLAIAPSPTLFEPSLAVHTDPIQRLFLGNSLEDFFRGGAFERRPYGPYFGTGCLPDNQFRLILGDWSIL
jgi:hypothetical protein